GLIRQTGLAATSLARDVAAKVVLQASGVPASGLNTTATMSVGGVDTIADGKITVADNFLPAFSGRIDINSPSLDTALALGDVSAPWSKTPFSSPVYGAVSGKLAVSAATLGVSDQLDLRNARFDVSLQPQRLDLNLTAAEIAGGTATGALTVNNIAGSANLS